MSENKREVIFVDGMFFKAPDEKTKEKAPWVKGHLSIKIADFIPFIRAYKDEAWLNIDLKKSKGGKLYLELNTYQMNKEQKAEVDDLFDEAGTGGKTETAPAKDKIEYPEEDISPEDIPF